MRAVALAVVALAVGCAEQAFDPEQVQRLAIAETGPEAVEAAGEMRAAWWLSAPHQEELCVDAKGRLALGVHAEDPGVTVRLEVAGRRDEAIAGNGWTDLQVTLSAGACARLEVGGPAGARAAVSQPVLLRAGRPRPWVVLYVVDTFRFDDSPFARDPTLAGPAFARFAADGILYRNSFSATSWTRPAVASLLTGLPPSLHGVFDRQDRLRGSLPRLSSLLAEAGWQSIALSTNPNILPVWGFGPGFDRFLDVGTSGWVHERGFATLERDLLAVVEGSADRPVFLYVHDNEPHLPYRPLPRYREMFGAPAEGSAAEIPQRDVPDDPATRALYRATIRATSDRFGLLIEALRRIGRYEDALIVLVGDHGEEFGEHGGISHGQTLYQEQLHVPLVVKLPGRRLAGSVVEAEATLEEVAPTLLATLGIDPPAAWRDRRLPLPGERHDERGPLVSELDLDGRRATSAIALPWKYLRSDGDEQLFDLSADPAETTDLAAAHPERVARLRAVVERRQVAGRAGLWLRCTAGARDQRLRLELRMPEGSAAQVTGIGLEEGDRVAATGAGVRADLDLRAPRAHDDLARLDPLIASQTQADRDALHVAGLAGEFVQVEIDARLDAADGSVLAGDGAPIPVARIDVAVPPPMSSGGAEPVCVLYHVAPIAESAAREELDPAVRERLRALGYLE